MKRESIDGKKHLIEEFLTKQEFAVVSSIWEGKPQSAVVVISVKDGLEIFFNTLKVTRKYRNLTADPNTSLVVGWDEGVTLQIEGLAEEVPSIEFTEYQRIHLSRNPGSEKYAHLDGQCFFRIIPKWIRYNSISGEKDASFEVQL
jgi:uncharacterized pyridoxamine 5'-phosphate oxidase family protein